MPKYLFAFDFDHTLVDDDSDRFVFQQLSPKLLQKVVLLELLGATKQPNPPLSKMTELQGQVQWTDLMNLLLRDLHAEGVNIQNIRDALAAIPFVLYTIA
jgi:pyridoxal phosphate phosphatase PHOSPHO2